MANVRKAFHLSVIGLRKWSSNPRYAVILVLLMLTTQQAVFPLNNVCRTIGVRVTPWLLPHYISTGFSPSLILLIALLLLFCDAPFISNNTPFECIRSGRRVWLSGKILYIILSSVIFTIVYFSLTVLWVLPNVYPSLEWGRVLETLAQTRTNMQLGFFIHYQMIVTYEPLAATLLSLIMILLQAIFMGLLIFAINLFFNSRLPGVVIGMIHASSAGVLDFFGWPTMFRYVPAAWLNLNYLDPTGKAAIPGLVYSYVAIALLCLLLTAICFFQIKRVPIEPYPEV